MAAKFEAELHFHLGDHSLHGWMKKGRWSFVCKSWPSLAQACKGHDTCEVAMEMFVERVADPEHYK